MKIKAAVLYGVSKPLIVEDDIDIPELKIGQVLVKIFFSGICRSQLMEVRGKRGNDQYLPHLLGHEATGEVIETGKGVEKVKKGDSVILTWIKCQGIDAGGSTYRKGNTIINSGSVTTFSNYSVVSENRCVKLPPGVPKDIGCLFGCAVLTGAGIITNTIKPAKSSSIAFFGLGGVGLSALMAAKLYDLSTVIAVDVEDSKLELAKHFGATHVVNSSTECPVGAIRNITGGKGVDYSIEAAGFVKTIEKAFESVRPEGGLCVFASHPAFNEKIRINPFDLICGKQIRGSWGGESSPDRDIPILAKLYLEGKLPLNKLISRHYTLNQINEALNDLENRKITRGMLAIG